ncbi:DUF4192 family protein [Microbacterium oryzae]|uniref:DUF4192 family protein n=1 Tax=Microbacterium oryzae TaxID=743009 RepID=UPI0025B19933|nr:DUF4192 family protein [Microbacterium oryzae]MDN3310156.1 DUF4192 family protein [Microbacterium oryzae]
MTTIIPARSAQKFLSVLPHVCGYLPRLSLVVVPIADGCTAAVARLDLPPDEEAWGEVAATALGVVCRLPDVTRFTAVIYTDRPFRDGDGAIAFDGFMRWLRERADHCGLDAVDALCVAADGWGSYLDDPGEARPLAEIAHEDALPDGVEPSAVLADQGDGVDLPASDLAERERVARALREVSRAADVLGGDSPAGIGGVPPRALAAVCLLGHLPEVFEECVGWDPDGLEPYLAAALVWALDRPFYRDVALSQWSADLAEGYRALEFNERWRAGDRSEPDGPIRLMGEGPRPDAERLERALALVRRLAAAAPREARVGPLVSAAWLSWALGRATHAAHYVHLVTEIEPDHGLASIIASMLNAAYLPPWAFRRP